MRHNTLLRMVPMAPVEMEKVKKFRNMLEACFHANKMKYHTRVVEIPPPPLGWLGLRAASTEIIRNIIIFLLLLFSYPRELGKSQLNNYDHVTTPDNLRFNTNI